MLVLVDSNEQATSPRTVKELRAVYPSLIIADLKCGDINVILDDGCMLAIERKEVHDFLASIGDGRLFKQVENMATNANYYAVIIEGSLLINYDVDMVVANGELTNWKGSSVRAAIFRIEQSACPVHFAPKGYYAEAVQEVIGWVSKGDKSFQRQHRRIVTFPPIPITQDILMAFPDVGFKRAESILGYVSDKSKGESIPLAEALCWITALDLIPKESRPAGWGNAMIKSFRETLGLKEGEYLDIRREDEIEDSKIVVPAEKDIPY